jgi:N-acetyltransferase 10
MGLGLAAALAKGLSNIYVTAPSAENLKTFFEFAQIGLEALGFQKSLHFEVVKEGDKN